MTVPQCTHPQCAPQLTKCCAKCQHDKPLSEFSRSAAQPDGLHRQCRDCVRAWARDHYRRHPEVKERKRVEGLTIRANPERRERVNAQRRDRWGDGRADRQKSYMTRVRERHFFVWRARMWSARHKARVTPQELARLWRNQRGYCALSGIKLGRSAELDHIAPASKGGAHTTDNLRWLDPRVNFARREMPDEEFIALCRLVARRWD